MSVDSVVTNSGRFTEAALKELSWQKEEPQWLRDLRLEALRIWENTPSPSRKDEEWRRTDLSVLDLNAVAPFSRIGSRSNRPQDLPEAVRSILGAGDNGTGLRVQVNSGGVYQELQSGLSSRGVVFSDMETAVREHPDLVQRYLLTQVSSGYGKYQALHNAFWSGGTFLYVPRNVEIQMPLRSLTWSDEPGLAVMPHTLIVLESGASVALVDEYASPDGGPALSNGVLEAVVGDGARLRYVNLQRWSRSVYSLGVQRAAIGRDAQLSTLSVVLGSRLTKSWIESVLKDQGASTEMEAIMFASGKQRFHHHTLQDHQAPNTTSNLLFKAALTDEARSEYSGLIKVHKDAQKTDAYQANRNLALSEHARADSMPKLEIEANDVRCTHGATVGPIDPEQVFYLQSRGLPRRVAERMIVEGFFEQVLERIPLGDVRESVRQAVTAKLEDRG